MRNGTATALNSHPSSRRYERWRTRDASSRRAGVAPEVIAHPEERLSVRSQVALLDEAANALNDDCLLHLAHDFEPANSDCCIT